MVKVKPAGSVQKERNSYLLFRSYMKSFHIKYMGLFSQIVRSLIEV